MPFKYATNTTRNALDEAGHLAWKFPFTEGRITKVSIKSRNTGSPAGTVDVLVDGASVLGEPKTVTKDWRDYETDTEIILNQPIEVFVSQNYTASDLTVSVTMQVGNKTIEFLGEPDIEPNVYVRGNRAAAWGADGTLTGDGLFRSVYMPAVNRLKTLYGCGFGAQTEDGKWYVCSDSKITGLDSAATTPVEYPIEDVRDMGMIYVNSGSNNSSVIYLLMQDGSMRSAGITNSKFIYETSSVRIISDNSGFIASAYKALFIRDNESGLFTHDYNYTSNKRGYATIFPEGMTIENIIQINGNYLLTDDGKIYYTTDGVNLSAVDCPVKVKKIWGAGVNAQYSNVFALGENNELYAKGTSTNNLLGLSASEGDNGGATYSEFTKVGVFDVKDIQGYGSNASFLLTEDGKLYHTGAAITNLVDAHSAFTRVFENYYFYDIAFANNTLVAIAERLGDMPEGD